MNRLRRAFTLVELLVAVSIIALLIGILLPTMSRVRKQANTAKCMNNMRQLVAAVSLYAHDNNEFLPYNSWGYKQGIPTWAYLDNSAAPGHSGLQTDVQNGLLWKYLNLFAVYHCPQDLGPWTAGTFNNLSSYCMNGATSGFGTNSYLGFNILRFHPDDVVFWEFTISAAVGDPADDGTNFPGEGVTARHKKGTCLGHIDGHADVMGAMDFSNLCQKGAITKSRG